MSVHERLRQLVAALPSQDSAVTFTRADLMALIDEEPGAAASGSTADLTVEEVAHETGRAPSTIRGWLTSEALRGYKLNGRDWRVPRAALRDYLDTQSSGATDAKREGSAVEITAWRTVRNK